MFMKHTNSASISRDSVNGPLTTTNEDSKVTYHDIILANREVALKMAFGMVRRMGIEMSRDEITSLSDMAICEAALRYRPMPDASFSTYSYYFLKAEIRKELKMHLHATLENNAHPEFQSEDSSSEESYVETRVSAKQEMCPERRLQAKEVVRSLTVLNPVEQTILLSSVYQKKPISEMAQELGYSRGHLFAIKKLVERKVRALICQSDYDLAA